MLNDRPRSQQRTGASIHSRPAPWSPSRLESAYRVKDQLARENLAGITHQVCRPLELTRGQLHLVTVAFNAARVQIHADVPVSITEDSRWPGERRYARTLAKSSSSENGFLT